jgi:hypothetical protein
MTAVSTRAVHSCITVGPTTSAVLAEVNDSRDKLVVHNEAGVLFVGLGSTVSPTNYAFRLTGNSTLEVAGYIGRVSGIKASGATSVFITELI